MDVIAEGLIGGSFHINTGNCGRKPVTTTFSGVSSARAESMSYLIIVAIGAIVGWVAGQYIKGSEHGMGIDIAAGAIGGCLAVLLSRMVGPAAAAGFFMSTVVAIIGAFVVLYGTRLFLKSREAPAPRARPRQR